MVRSGGNARETANIAASCRGQSLMGWDHRREVVVTGLHVSAWGPEF